MVTWLGQVRGKRCRVDMHALGSRSAATRPLQAAPQYSCATANAIHPSGPKPPPRHAWVRPASLLPSRFQTTTGVHLIHSSKQGRWCEPPCSACSCLVAGTVHANLASLSEECRRLKPPSDLRLSFQAIHLRSSGISWLLKPAEAAHAAVYEQTLHR